MNKSKTALLLVTTGMYISLIIGSLLALLYLICIAASADATNGDAMFISTTIIVGLPAFLLLYFGIQKKKLIDEFKKYVAIISKVPNGFIPDIAATLNTSVDVVKRNLDLMIKKQFFANAYIDHDSNCIIINGKKAQNNMTSPSANKLTQSETQTPRMVTVKCEGCGAPNAIQKGTVGECEYCGTPIKS